MIRDAVRSGATYHVIGAVRGLSAEPTGVLASVEAFAPTAVGLGLSVEEYRGMRDHFVNTPHEPVVTLTETELAEIRGLAQFGEVRVPNPTPLAVIAWGEARGVPVEPLDPSDDVYSTMFSDMISYVELVRRTVRERRLTRFPPVAKSPDDYALAWDRAVGRGAGSVRFATARDSVLVRSALRLGQRHPRVSVIVDRERFDRVLGLLRAPTPWILSSSSPQAEVKSLPEG